MDGVSGYLDLTCRTVKEFVLGWRVSCKQDCTFCYFRVDYLTFCKKEQIDVFVFVLLTNESVTKLGKVVGTYNTRTSLP